MGKKVTASEYSLDQNARQKWEDLGILYKGQHDEKFINKNIDLVIIPNGILPNNPEIEKAKDLKIPTLTLGQLTGILSKNYKTIAIAGTHGKTTTTSLIIWMLHKLDKTPNFIVGDKIMQINQEWNVNPDSKYFVVEACEYKRQFLDRAPNPFISVITNIDIDHTDYYKDQEDYNSAFVQFLSSTQEAIVIDAEKENECKVLKQIPQKNIIEVEKYRKQAYQIKSPLVGTYNKENILKAYCTALALGFSHEQIKAAFVDFPGVAKRMEFKGKTIQGSPIYLDYAHNPQKVKSCIEGVKEQFPNKKLIFVFQPHSHERTYTFRKEFANAVKNADYLLIPNIFKPTREEEKYVKLIDSEQFVEYITRENKSTSTFHTEDFVKTVQKIKEIEKIEKDCIIVLASAGDLYKITQELIEEN
ncbi:MAG TPA: Mur ligase family protein [Candidatus Dojkabacteria bacterium]|nr:Mur ligase family protein [Candidatus Dojkabacteria bacterium]HQF36847.1 Mur ligase family protein [Candidatus Dojkabacteria bacterium]